MVDARNVSMLSLDITVHNGIASHGRHRLWVETEGDGPPLLLDIMDG